MSNTSYNRVDTLKEFNELKLPMVIISETENNVTTYIGFVPGIELKKITSLSVDTCKSNLLKETKSKVKEMIENDLPFPFFPTKEEIMEDFENVCYIKFLNIKK